MRLDTDVAVKLFDDVSEDDTLPVRVIVAEIEGDIHDDLLPKIVALLDAVKDCCTVSVLISEVEGGDDTEAI